MGISLGKIGIFDKAKDFILNQLDKIKISDHTKEKVINKLEKNTIIGKSREEAYFDPDYQIDCDGKIGDFAQGQIGDCWFLSGLKGVSEKNPNAFKDNISEDKNNIYVKCFGIKDNEGNPLTYSFNKEELSKYDDNRFMNYSVGDDDTLMLELVYQKLKMDSEDKKFDLYIPDINGGTISSFSNFLSILGIENGNNVYLDFVKSDKQKEIYNIFDKKYEDSNVILNFNIYSLNGEESIVYKENNYDENGTLKGQTNIPFYFSHAYAVKNWDEKNLTLVNPWDSSKDIVVDKKQFLNFWSEYHNKNGKLVFANFDGLSLSDNNNDNKKDIVANNVSGIQEVNIDKLYGGFKRVKPSQVVKKKYNIGDDMSLKDLILLRNKLKEFE